MAGPTSYDSQNGNDLEEVPLFFHTAKKSEVTKHL